MTDTPGINPTVPPSGAGCVECDATDGWWLHLRRCAECGHVGCCDNSPAQHATHHANDTGHPIAQSYEPGEDWFWNYRSEDYAYGPALTAPTSHPADQTAPGPANRVPHNWMALLNP
ncbi:UBP-type zinc finger domain-containing protein [Curtobacterium flaccumfaciens pv. flaccumfaciens]|uniref:UBP-type zinc finger domain-containing protein n=1 Tax=Curtobacterium flaccumfaciens TaxID=2035 RepID=UPI001BCDEAE0|nr:UBP-type zinc finger domain-containing protein [Curtobacterium flaccumfaciens]QVG65567.1 UBP-type zinc finger domain-containing protein [Curtobacterium flaccumfaciens pv. flaccumfaciens]